MTVIIIIIVIVLLLLALLLTYNRLVALRNKVNEAFATMDVFLKKRFDLIPRLVEAVKGYARYESDTLQQATRLRTTAVGDALKHAFVVAEAYPDRKADNSFLKLQEQLAKMEDEISLSRRYYNGSVREYNNLCQMFPVSLVASAFGFKPMPMFAVSSDEERQAVNVNL